MDVVREDMQIVGVGEKDAKDSYRWRKMIHGGNC